MFAINSCIQKREKATMFKKISASCEFASSIVALWRMLLSMQSFATLRCLDEFGCMFADFCGINIK